MLLDLTDITMSLYLTLHVYVQLSLHLPLPQTMEVTSLEVLEALMTEFFAPGTSNTRKHQIEKVLEDFGRRPDAWKNCLLCIAGTANPYVTMFCMTSLEVRP